MNGFLPELSFLLEGSNDNPRVLIVSPHPDDEVIGAGSRLPHLRNAVVLQVTDGSPPEMSDARAAGYANREAYAEARHRELCEALRLCGRMETIELHLPDQHAAFQLPHLIERMDEAIRRIEPDYVITVPYEGGHPDHDATAFAVHEACARAVTPPVIVEMLSYHNEQGRCVMDGFLNEDQEVLTIQLSPDQIAFKDRLFECFASQQHVLKWFPIRFEKFRIAPIYDFTEPPHQGQLYYEMFPWGLTCERWCDLARRVAPQLLCVS